MPEITDKKRKYQAVPGGQFVAGNPGRPKEARNFTTKVREALEKIADGQQDVTNETLLIKSILNNGINKGIPKTQELIWSYLDGKAPQKIELDGKILNDSNTDYAGIPGMDEIRKRHLDEIRQAIAKQHGKGL